MFAVIGGTVSAIGGGKFKNGAITGAFSRMFNEVAKDQQVENRTEEGSCASEPMCVARPTTKKYPGPNGSDGVRTWYGRKEVEVSAKYTCTDACGSEVDIEGTRTVKFFFEEGYELAPYGVEYEKRWNAFSNRFDWTDPISRRFDPLKSDVPELIKWAKKLER